MNQAMRCGCTARASQCQALHGTCRARFWARSVAASAKRRYDAPAPVRRTMSVVFAGRTSGTIPSESRFVQPVPITARYAPCAASKELSKQWRRNPDPEANAVQAEVCSLSAVTPGGCSIGLRAGHGRRVGSGKGTVDAAFRAGQLIGPNRMSACSATDDLRTVPASVRARREEGPASLALLRPRALASTPRKAR